MKNTYLLVCLLVFIISCNKNMNTIETWFKNSLVLNQIFDSLDTVKKWNLSTHGFEIDKAEDLEDFKRTVILAHSGQSNGLLSLNFREEFIKFIKDSMDKNKHCLGVVIKERLSSGSKVSYKVSLYLVTNVNVIVYHYTHSPDGFILNNSYTIGKNEFMKSLEYSLFSTSTLNKTEKKGILYCISVFTKEPIYSKMVYDDNYFDDSKKW